MTPTRLAVATALISLLTFQSVAQNLVANGSFATGDLADWTVQNASNGSGFFVYSDASEHYSNSLLFAGNGPEYDAISQNLVTAPGLNYQLSFSLRLFDVSQNAPYNYSDFAPSFIASLNGISVFVAPASTSPTQGYTTTVFKTTFTAISEATTLSFSGYNRPSIYTLDDISVSAVPEIATSWMLFAGVCCILSLELLRKKLETTLSQSRRSAVRNHT